MNTFKAHDKVTYGVAFSPDGGSLLTTGGDEKMRLWSLDPVALAREWPGTRFHGPVAFSGDGKFVARGGYEASVWPVGETERALVKTQYAHAVAFSPDAREWAVHTNEDEGLQRYQLPKGKKLKGGWGGSRGSTGGGQFCCGGMAFSPDGTLAMTFGVSTPQRYVTRIYLWGRRGSLDGILLTETPSEHSTHLCFSPDGGLLAGASGHLMRVWDVKRGSEVTNLNLGKKFFKNQVFDPGGKFLLTVGQDEMVTRWSVKDWKQVDAVDCKIGKLTCLAVTGRARYAAGSDRGKVAVWDE